MFLAWYLVWLNIMNPPVQSSQDSDRFRSWLHPWIHPNQKLSLVPKSHAYMHAKCIPIIIQRDPKTPFLILAAFLPVPVIIPIISHPIPITRP
jgi:hypothetical protein